MSKNLIIQYNFKKLLLFCVCVCVYISTYILCLGVLVMGGKLLVSEDFIYITISQTCKLAYSKTTTSQSWYDLQIFLGVLNILISLVEVLKWVRQELVPNNAKSTFKFELLWNLVQCEKGF
jgi:hypothetical protein